ncbi:smoothened homolog [Folsomia candida]|uniref:smoothened homolog n=1 Tax=Folsomia candida TaxID=158441 RepID=UPI000B8F7689|nr:smoothened homolog [Folsomia candida]XP_021947838.1 smoothened homolog [Folsomia candida]XP_035706222.1 smoothened homolog [Folsomia candida]
MAVTRWVLSLLAILAPTVVAVQELEHNVATRVGNGMGFVISENSNCYQKVKGTCQPLQPSTLFCFGVQLPYTMTSPELVNENFTQQQLHSEMMRWEGLRSSPKCWAVIQPLLCSYYFPKCQDGFIELPPLDRCRIARNPCRVIEQATKQWPEFLQCNDTLLFPPRPPGSNCKYELRESLNKFNTSAKCMDPMMEVENTFNHYEGFDGCALKCEDPYFSKEDHTRASTVIWYFGVAALLSNGWVVLTYIIGGMSSSQYPQYPSAIVLYANAWYFIASVGWLFQYLPLGKEDIVCRKDGTVRRNEITGTENIFCGLVSSWIYFSIMSVLAWLMVFSYVWYLTCSAVGRIRSKVDKQRAYFIVWTIAFPTILTVVCLSVGKIDGSSMYGICFVGFYDPTSRILLVFIPIGFACALILFYIFRGTHCLFSVSLSSSDFISAEGNAEIKSNAVRATIFSLLTIVLLGTGFYVQINSIRSQPTFDNSLRESFLCKMNLTVVAECGTPEKPSVYLVLENVIVFFCGGLLVSSWAWTSSSINIWKHSIKTFCKSHDQEGHRSHMPKHELITKAYAKRGELAKGRLSLSLYSMAQEDPIGLNRLLDPNNLCRNADEEQSQQFSQGTGDGREISSEWAAAIPQFLNRRGAIVVPPSSNSVSYVSEDSRRPSCDSAMSEQIAAKYLQGSHGGLDRKASKRERFRMDRHHRAGRFFNYWKRKGSNRGSSTSLESNPGSQILPAITKLIDKREQMGDDNLFLPNNQATRLNQPKVLREFAIQTSLEKLCSPSTKGIKPCNLSNNLCVDKATQYSLVNLNEVGTQTKKSATKKRDRNKNKKDHATGGDGDGTTQGNSTQTGTDDAVLKLLTPN